MARRLLDAGLTVLLLEAGSERVVPAIDDPVRMHELWDSAVDWGFRTVAQEHAHDRQLHLPRGRVVGGSHALNGMIWVRGHPLDYDLWAYLGNAGWSWADVRAVFRRIESVDGRSSDGVTGLQEVITKYQPDPVHEAIVEAAMQHGLLFNSNYNGSRPDGVSFTQLTIRGGRRYTTARSYLGPVRDDARLRVV